ncbi:MAG TPA: precorrin-6A synthase (deacetylating) [Polyangiales bacterium]|nr:precorrin-6A synthase (deacetylating) [Polyangiales bacterium]
MRTILVIGIGAGNPEHLTVQAIRALNEVDVFFALDKGASKRDLLALRHEICERYIEKERTYRFVEVQDPVRDEKVAAYDARVDAWHGERVELLEQALRDQLPEHGTGAFLVWGDPSLYDSTLRLLERMIARARLPFVYRVIPGISSVQALAASHRITLNQIGGAVHITTGRKLGEAREQTDVIVMLDGECAFKQLPGEDYDIWWGAYAGSDDELLRAGRLSELSEEIERVRAAARAQRGWIMDTYLLRRRA